jgi:hypothetical protein
MSFPRLCNPQGRPSHACTAPANHQLPTANFSIVPAVNSANLCALCVSALSPFLYSAFPLLFVTSASQQPTDPSVSANYQLPTADFSAKSNYSHTSKRLARDSNAPHTYAKPGGGRGFRQIPPHAFPILATLLLYIYLSQECRRADIFHSPLPLFFPALPFPNSHFGNIMDELTTQDATT